MNGRTRGEPWLVAVAFATLVLAACGSKGSGAGAGSSAGGAAELTVFAASSLTGAFTEIGGAFEAAHPGTKVTFDFGSSGDLAPQIETEGTADVFASASPTYMDDVQRKVGVSGRVDFARNKLVMITPPDDPAGVKTLRDLTRPDVQVVLAARGVPVGDYARQALASAGIEKAVLANVVSNEPDDASLVARITAGEADAAIVYTSDVTSEGARLRAISIPAHDNVVAPYPIAMVKGSPHSKLAQTFVDYVTGAAGQATLRKFGFLPPRPV